MSMITALEDQDRIDRHFAIELFAEAAKMDIRKTCKDEIESSNRRFGQLNRYTRVRFDLAKMETENFGDDAGCWGDS